MPPPTTHWRGTALGLLKLYGVSLASFLVVGGFVAHIYLAVHGSATDRWSADAPLPWPSVALIASVAFLVYLPAFLPVAAGPAALVTSLYCALVLTFARTSARVVSGTLRGALAAVIAALAASLPEVAYTGSAWWAGVGTAAVLAGGVSGALATAVVGLWKRARPPLVDPAPMPSSATGRAIVVPAMAWTLALAGTAAIAGMSLERTDKVRLRHMGTAAATDLRSMAIAEKSDVIAELLTGPTHKSSIAESVAGQNLPQRRPLADRAAIGQELERLQQRAGPILSTRMMVSFEVIQGKHLEVTYVDRHEHEESKETLVYSWAGGAPRLETYNLMLGGPSRERPYASVLIQR
ncbi:MAG: hypothetical protein ACREUW_16465 [Burkholderiales bacterium]